MAQPNFLIGVFSQPTKDFAKWRDRGINFLCSHEPESGKMPKAQWEAAAAAAQLYFMDYPDMGNLKAEAAQPYRLAWMQDDEPDLISHINKPGSSIVDLRAKYQTLKAQFPKMPVYLNCAGSCFDNQWYDGFPKPGKTDASQWGHRAPTGYFGQGDWLNCDYYLAQSGRKGAFAIHDTCYSRINDWSGGKPYFVTIETSNGGNQSVSFSADDFEQELMRRIYFASKMGHKLLGVIYWTHKTIPGWTGWDNTQPDVVDRMMAINSRLAAYAGDLPWDKVYTPVTSVPTDLSGVRAAAAAALDASTRVISEVGKL